MPLIVAAMLLQAAPAALPARPVGLRDFALGMTIDAFREHGRRGGKSGQPEAVCTDDVARPVTWLRSQLPGAVVCSFGEWDGQSWSREGLILTNNITASVEFVFVNQSLVQIEAYFDLVGRPSIEESLVSRFGQPTERSVSIFQTRSGATFPQDVVRWLIGTQSVTLTAPDLRDIRMSVIYRDTAALQRIEAARPREDFM